jgi:mannose-6-phosphate isomerase-like protein (cupin superfamily)
MNYFNGNIEKLTLENTDYRRVIFTGNYSQLVLMSIPVGEDIEFEIHPYVDQFFRFESGKGKIFLGKNRETSFLVTDGSGIVIPSNTYHYIINTGDVPLKLYSIYSPPNHPRDKVEHTKIVEDKIVEDQIVEHKIKHKKILLFLL